MYDLSDVVYAAGQIVVPIHIAGHLRAIQLLPAHVLRVVSSSQAWAHGASGGPPRLVRPFITESMCDHGRHDYTRDDHQHQTTD
ncbi:hypothetical protein A5634_23765 [Mycobacterium asiaticum]|uniref:Uncharacterized protein n=1 Tax=Mycobacterium asiaticum TaxID=1790 RepID=A0A1A3P1Q7_MYCAS|nr:hypothetical protein A5634_23765 [Mycobacterium asiaticum]